MENEMKWNEMDALGSMYKNKMGNEPAINRTERIHAKACFLLTTFSFQWN